MNKIIEYCDRFYPVIGGVQANISSIVLNIQDYEFKIVTNAITNNHISEQYGKNTIIKRFLPYDYSLTGLNKPLFNKILFPYMIYADIKRFYNKKEYLEKGNFDLIHFHGRGVIETNIKYIANILNYPILIEHDNFEFIKKPKLLTMHGLFQRLSTNRNIKKYEDNFIDQFENIICVDKNIHKFLLDRYGKNTGKNIYFIPNSVDVNLFNFSEMRDGKKLIIGFVGRLEGSRGTNLLYNLIKKLPEYVELQIVGAGNKVAVEKFKSRVDVSKIRFYQNLKNEEIPGFLHNINILFNPVLAEGISRITLEAMSCGRPVIMLDKGDRYPTINGKTGYLIKEDINELLSLFEYINDNRNELEKLGKNARKIVEEEFSNEVIIPKIKKIYGDLMK